MIGVPTGVFVAIGNHGRRVALLGLTALALAMLPATAVAADPTSHQYASNLDQVPQGGGGAGAVGDPGATGGDPGGLPFTGLDVGLLAIVAASLVVAGLLLRRRRTETTEA